MYQVVIGDFGLKDTIDINKDKSNKVTKITSIGLKIAQWAQG